MARYKHQESRNARCIIEAVLAKNDQAFKQPQLATYRKTNCKEEFLQGKSKRNQASAHRLQYGKNMPDGMDGASITCASPMMRPRNLGWMPALYLRRAAMGLLSVRNASEPSFTSGSIIAPSSTTPSMLLPL